MRNIVVLGMHRAGTSMVSRILHECGISMGVDLLAGDELNPDGYFEDEHFLTINKTILKHCGGGWSTPPSRNCVIKRAGRYERMIQRTISNRIAQEGHKDWGFKDPRTSLTIWFIHQYLINPFYIVVRRNKQDVISSLQRSWNVDRDWEEVYDLYNNSISEFILDVQPKHCEIAYEDLVDTTKYAGALTNLFKNLGLNDANLLKAVDIIQFKRF